MGLSCGLVGLPSCGKTVIFNAVTAAGVSSYNGSEMNRAVVNIPDQRINRLVEIYHPRKTTLATLEVVDIPGIGNSPQGSGRGSKLLGNIKDVDALLHVVRCFDNGAQKIDPVRDIETVDLELLAADATTVENKLTRLAKKARVGDKDAVRDSAACEKVRKAIQEGIPARKQGLNEQELAAVWECNLASLKPVFYIANVASMTDAARPEVAALKELARKEGAEVIVICGKDEADISQLDPADRPEFLRELGLTESSIERLLGAAAKTLGIVHFFTSGEDEVRAWTCRKGDKAPVAAGKIHSDMEKGFIRMEVTRYDDLMELGSEAAVSKAGKHRVESRDYVVQDGDIVNVLFNS